MTDLTNSGPEATPENASVLSDRGIASVVGPVERPDLAVERLSVAASDPDLVPKDIDGMLVAFLPDHVRPELRPPQAVARVPHVAPIPRRIIGPASHDPHPIAVDLGIPSLTEGHARPYVPCMRDR